MRTFFFFLLSKRCGRRRRRLCVNRIRYVLADAVPRFKDMRPATRKGTKTFSTNSWTSARFQLANPFVNPRSGPKVDVYTKWEDSSHLVNVRSKETVDLTMDSDSDVVVEAPKPVSRVKRAPPSIRTYLCSST